MSGEPAIAAIRPVEGLRLGARPVRARPGGAPGEVFGFLGPNGAGKSTTMRLLLDLIRPTSGSARVLGLDTRTDSLEIRRRVGFLPGDLALYPKLTGRAVLDYLAAAARRRRPARARLARGALRRRPRPADPAALDRQPAEARPDPGVHARARALDPRRADRRTRPARAAELPRAAPRGQRRGPHGLPVLAHAVGGRARHPSPGDPAPGPARGGRLAREPPPGRRPAPRDRVRASPSPADEFRALPGVRDVEATG